MDIFILIGIFVLIICGVNYILTKNKIEKEIDQSHLAPYKIESPISKISKDVASIKKTTKKTTTKKTPELKVISGSSKSTKKTTTKVPVTKTPTKKTTKSPVTKTPTKKTTTKAPVKKSTENDK